MSYLPHTFKARATESEIADVQRLCIEALALQKKALNATRWSYLNEAGAFAFRDAVRDLREASLKLDAVAFKILREYPQYAHLRAPVSPLKLLRVA